MGRWLVGWASLLNSLHAGVLESKPAFASPYACALISFSFFMGGWVGEALEQFVTRRGGKRSPLCLRPRLCTICLAPSPSALLWAGGHLVGCVFWWVGGWVGGWAGVSLEELVRRRGGKQSPICFFHASSRPILVWFGVWAVVSGSLWNNICAAAQGPQLSQMAPWWFKLTFKTSPYCHSQLKFGFRGGSPKNPKQPPATFASLTP